MALGSVRAGSVLPINGTQDGAQTGLRLAPLPGGGFAAVWESAPRSGPDGGLWGQTFNARGKPVGEAHRIVDGAAVAAGVPEIVRLADGNLAVAWQRSGFTPPAELVTQVFTPEWEAVSEPVAVIGTPSFFQPGLVALPDGGYSVLWTKYDPVLRYTGMYARAFDADGNAQGPIRTLTGPDTRGSAYYDATLLTDGRSVSVWGAQEFDDADIFQGSRVVARFQSRDGTLRKEIALTPLDSASTPRPEIAALADGGFVVAWDEANLGGSYEGGAFRVFDADGKAETRVLSFNPGTPPISFNAVEVAALPDGGFVIVWVKDTEDGPFGRNWEIHAKRYDSEARLVGDEFKVNPFTAVNIESGPTISVFDDGSYVIGWAKSIDGGVSPRNPNDLFVQKFKAQMIGSNKGDTLDDRGGADTILGRNGNDRLFGRGGDDRIDGGKGNDRLRGDAGNDVLLGGVGKDTLDGGAGRDRMTGGAGADTFVFGKGDGHDRITDFTDDVDTLTLDSALWKGTLTVNEVLTRFAHVAGGSVVLDFGADEITLTAVTRIADLRDDIAIF